MTIASHRATVLGTSATILCTDPDRLARAWAAARVEIDAIDRCCSRFREDSELVELNRQAGRDVIVSPTLFEALEVAQRAAELTAGRVTPTVGRAISALGYDRDFVSVPPTGPPLQVSIAAVPAWQDIELDPARHRVRFPAAVELDLGATAKALAVDRAALAACDASGVGVLISIGGDLRAAGPAPADGWVVQVAPRHQDPLDTGLPAVALHEGGLATSGPANRHWRRGSEDLHHLIDPRSGRSADAHWSAVTVGAASCVDANIASTAASIMGPKAPEWLARVGLSARLVGVDGRVRCVGSWPAEPRPTRWRRAGGTTRR